MRRWRNESGAERGCAPEALKELSRYRGGVPADVPDQPWIDILFFFIIFHASERTNHQCEKRTTWIFICIMSMFIHRHNDNIIERERIRVHAWVTLGDTRTSWSVSKNGVEKREDVENLKWIIKKDEMKE